MNIDYVVVGIELKIEKYYEKRLYKFGHSNRSSNRMHEPREPSEDNK